MSPPAPIVPSETASSGGPPEPPRERAAEGDRRVVTVLFADLSGFTALSERLDPEDVRAFQNDLFRELSAAIARYEGFVEKFVGDAVMAVFGAPQAHEDDPERALRAALVMHESAAALSQRWEARLGRPLALHIGVNTGPVVAGTLGSGVGSAYAVTGDTVNTAARLQSAAAPGQTLVSPATHHLTEHVFLFEAVGELVMKGKSQPTQAYRLTARREMPGSRRALATHGRAVPLVGRDAEWTALVAAFDRMMGSQAQVVTLVGEAGIGKSRLLEEFLAWLEREGRLRAAAVRRATCASLGDPPYAIWATFFRDGYGVATDESLAAAREKLASGLAALGADPDEPAAIAPLLGYVLGVESGERFHHIEPEQLKRQILLAVRRLVERRLQQGPLVLVVENLQWADAASVELLRSVMDRLADRPLLLVATCRPSVDPGALATTRATGTPLRLTPLSAGDSERLLAAHFGPSAARLPPRLRDLILHRAGGHPLFLEELVRSLIAAGTLVAADDGWAATAEAGAVDVPATIQGLLLARVDRLPPATRRLLHEAAVVGAAFDADLLREIAADPATVDVALDGLEDAGLIEALSAPAGALPGARSGPTHRFTQALLHEVAYQNLLVRRRAELHGRVGRTLETRAGGGPERLENLEALGWHFSLSGDTAKGARYLVRAGDWARDLYANDDAVRHYERALDILHTAPDGTQWAIREQLADLLGPMGRRDAARAHYEAIFGACAAADDRPAQARLHRKIAGLLWDGGERGAAVARLEAGLALMEGTAEHIELAHLHQEMGRLLFRSGDNRGAIEWTLRARAHAERLAEAAATDPVLRRHVAAVAAQAENTLGVALARTGRLPEAVSHIQQSVALAEAHELLQAACRAYTNLGVLYSTLDPKRAIETCLSGLAMATRIGDLGFQSRLNTNLAVAYCALTNRCEEQGLSAAQTALDLDRQLGHLDHLAVPLIVLGQIQQCHGDPEKALGYYREALDVAEQTGEPQILFPCYDGLATLYLDRGDEAKAEEFMLKAQQVCSQAGLEPDAFMVLPFLE